MNLRFSLFKHENHLSLDDADATFHINNDSINDVCDTFVLFLKEANFRTEQILNAFKDTAEKSTEFYNHYE